MATYYVRKDRALDGSEGPPDASGLFYWFDGSDAAATDPDGAWTDETNADDSDISTFASCSTAGSALTNYVKIEGTDAPASGGTISSVDVWVRSGPTVETSIRVAVYEDGASLLESDMDFVEATNAWLASTDSPVTAPGGGWTWAKVQALEVRVYTTGSTEINVAAVGVMVHTTTDGESVTYPFRTIDDAANEVAAGDTVYIGAGVFRETVTIDTNGSSGSPITWVGDVDGSRTGDAGLVIISAYNSETSAASRSSCLAETTNDVKYNTFRGLTLVGGASAVVLFNDITSANSYEGLVFEDCAIIGGHDDNDLGILLDYNAVTAPTGDGVRIRRCLFDACGIEFQFDEDTSEKDWDILVEDCVFTGGGDSSGGLYGIVFDRVTASTNPPGGALITNCTFSGMYYAVRSSDALTAAPSNTWDVRNCLFRSCNASIAATTTSPFTSDYNLFTRGSALSGVSAGTNDRQETDDPGLLGSMGDWTLWRFWGWSPYRPFEPIALNDGAYVHAVIGVANAADAPAVDAFNDPRPMGPGTDNADDVGAVEARARLEQETTTVRTGSNAGRMEGAGFHDYLIPVAAASTTVEIYGRFDSNYTGSLPTIELMNAPGVTTLPTDIMTGAANQWEAISITFTPTAAGMARVRVSSQDTSTTGEAFFDDLTVT